MPENMVHQSISPSVHHDITQPVKDMSSKLAPVRNIAYKQKLEMWKGGNQQPVGSGSKTSKGVQSGVLINPQPPHGWEEFAALTLRIGQWTLTALDTPC